MHSVYRFGDDLSVERPSVVTVNQTLQPIHGFEVGKIYSGFRHIYPILTQDQHLGSVEFSQTFEAMRKKVALLDDRKEYLLVHRRSLIESKLAWRTENRFQPSVFSDHWLEEDPLRQLPGSPPPNSLAVTNVASSLKSDLAFREKLNKGIDFAVLAHQNDQDYVLTFIGLKNILGQNAGYLIAFQHDRDIPAMRFDAWVISGVTTIMSAVLFFFVWGWLNSKRQQAQSLNFLESVNQVLSEGLFVVDAQGRVTEVNPAATDFIGQDKKHIIGQSVDEYWKVVAAEESNEQVRLHQLMAEKAPFSGEVQVLNGKGKPTWLYVSCRPLIEEGQAEGYVVVFHDISTQKLNEANLRISAAAFETREGILITDKSGVVLRVNKAFTVLTGYESAEIVGATPAILNSGRQSKAFYQKMWKDLIANQSWQGEIWNRRKDGELYLE